MGINAHFGFVGIVCASREPHGLQFALPVAFKTVGQEGHIFCGPEHVGDFGDLFLAGGFDDQRQAALNGFGHNAGQHMVQGLFFEVVKPNFRHEGLSPHDGDSFKRDYAARAG